MRKWRKHDVGVETVKADLSSNKVTVTGKLDAEKLRDKIAERTKKKVDIISAPPKKEAAATENPPEKKVEEKNWKGSLDLHYGKKRRMETGCN